MAKVQKVTYTEIPFAKATDAELQFASKGCGLDSYGLAYMLIIGTKKMNKEQRDYLIAGARKICKATAIRVDLKHRVTDNQAVIAYENCEFVRSAV